MGLSALETRVVHEAECPEEAPVTCANGGMERHWHDQSVRLARLDLGVTLGLGKGFTLGVGFPLDLKVLGIEYYLEDGTPYDPPYGDIHHRNERLFGPGDGRWTLGWAIRPIATPLLFAFNVGTSLPFGKTEENPVVLSAQELWHQHVQFGSGTFVPALGFDLAIATTPVGLYATVGARLPFYSSKKGYRPGPSFRAAAGPTLQPPPPLRELHLSVLAELAYEGVDQWSGVAEETSGRTSVTMVMTAGWSPAPAFSVAGTLRAAVFEYSHHGTISMPVVLGLSVSGLVQLPKPAPKL